MSDHSTHSWEADNILDDIDFRDEEALLFQSLIGGKCRSVEAASSEKQFSVQPMIGSILSGAIVEVTKDFVVVDVGLKSEGVIPISEFSDPQDISLGNQVDVLFDQPEDDAGQIVLSREKAERMRQWEDIVQNCEEGSIVKGKVLRRVKGGLIVDIGMEAFLPGSLIDIRKIKNLDDYIGQTLEFKILKINIDRKNVVISRRELLEAERYSKRAKLLESIQIGDRCKGVVKNITDFGAFLDLDGIDGLLHITDMAWEHVEHPSEVVRLGQHLEVIVLKVDRDKERVALGLKQTGKNPWEAVEAEFPPGTRVRGKVVKLSPYGARIELRPGLQGLVHNSEISWDQHVRNAGDLLEMGQEVDVVVLSVQKEEGKLSLSIKQVQYNPWDDVETKYPVGKQVQVVVKNLTSFGAYVELEPGVEGLIRLAELSWTKKIAHPSEILKKSDVIEALVLSIDKEGRRRVIIMSLKQLTPNPWQGIEERIFVGSQVSGKVVKTMAFGAFVELEGGIEGLIHVSELSDRPISRVEDVVSEGDQVSCRVLGIEPEQKRIMLSLRKSFSGQNSHYDDIIVTS